MHIEEIHKPLNKFEYAEITEAELTEHPALEKATSMDGLSLEMEHSEWKRTQDFLDMKWHERSNLFIINEKYLEDELNKSTATAKMRSIFAAEGFPIPENSFIRQDGDIWYIIKRYYLFSITDPELESELNRINMTTGKNTGEYTGDLVPVKLKNAFASGGFPLPENARISRDDREWVIPAGIGYTILIEAGRVNVYTGDEKTYEIRREGGKFKVVYSGPQVSPIFKIREKYYRFSFWIS